MADMDHDRILYRVIRLFVPDFLVDLLRGKDLSGMFHQKLEYLILCGGQPHFLSFHDH